MKHMKRVQVFKSDIFDKRKEYLINCTPLEDLKHKFKPYIDIGVSIQKDPVIPICFILMSYVL